MLWLNNLNIRTVRNADINISSTNLAKQAQT